MINRLPPEELLRAVRETQADWRTAIRRDNLIQPDSRSAHESWARKPALREPCSAPEPGRPSVAASGF